MTSHLPEERGLHLEYACLIETPAFAEFRRGGERVLKLPVLEMDQPFKGKGEARKRTKTHSL